MKKILALTAINNTVALKEAVEKIRKEYGNIVKIRKIYFDEYEKPDVPIEPLEKDIDSSDIILVDVRGDIRVGRELPRMLEGKEKTVVVLVAGRQDIWKLTKMGKFKGEMIFKGEEKEFNIHTYIKAKKFSELAKKLGKIIPFGRLRDMRNWVLAQQYYSEGGAENLKNLILLLLKEYGGVEGIKKIPPPKIFDYGLYLPGKGLLDDIESYKRMLPYNPKKPVVGALLYGGIHFDECRVMADALYEHLKNDVNLIFIVSKVEYNIEAIYKYLKNLNIDLFLNLQYFRIHGGPFGGEPEPTYKFLQKADVPLLIGLRSYSTDIEKWKESKEGLNPLEVVLGVALPELDGGIEPIFISGLESLDDPTIGKVKRAKILEDRVEKLGTRIKKWIALRNTPNNEKRIAILTYNYPPGEDNLASAGYLDVFESLKIFLEKLKEKGYNIEIPSTTLKELFLSSGIVNSPNYIQKSGLRVATDRYTSWFKSLPESAQKDVRKHWGEPPGNVMVDGGNILIPGIILGNVFLGIQPSRGVHEDPDKTYHDKDLPPHHQYLAYYFFLEKEFRADAVIHFGMHGTLEFTKGKEIALSSECFPDILIGNMPHIYYYWIGNPSESTIAKRRSYAICISHASPPMRTSGLYEKYIILEDLLNQYDENKDEKTLEVIKETAGELHLPLETAELRKELYKMKRRLIPYGLHIMDRKFTEEEMVDYLLGVLRIDREFPSILKLLAKQKELDWDKIKESKLADEIESHAVEVIREILYNKSPEWLPKGYDGFVGNIVKNVYKSSESDALLHVLEGRYIFPARAGDPIRDPEVYPSGRAMYAFDPRLIPTIAAELRGRKAAELLIGSYLRNYGRYPESVGIVLWGFETMKTGGDTIATILSLLGVRIKHKKSPWFKELEVIPIEELNRPRIDVVITICGIFRDTFGTHIDLINRAIEMVASLDESPERNYIRKHFLQLKG
ncbi:MAG: cobaltochelatase subunit CobN, partial [Candidatus Omnitrophica bacterium]|nr:cobaltochelatase subunit CobN [Candidatus Omnitrophota bacterium]